MRTRLAVAISATALAGGLAASFAAPSLAFAQSCGGASEPACPTAGLSITASVPVTESISLNEASGSAVLSPGNPTTVFPAGASSPGALFVTYTTNDAAGWTGNVGEVSALTAGSATIPDTDVSTAVFPDALTGSGIGEPGTPTYTAFNASGSAITLASETTPTGELTSGAGNYFGSQGSSDALYSNFTVSTPGNQPGGSYAASFVYSIIGA